MLLGRQTAQTDYEANGVTAAFSRTQSYKAKGQLATDDSTVRKARTGTSGYDSLRTLTRHNYAWRDGAVTSGIVHPDWTANGGPSYNRINPGNFDQQWVTSYNLDALGQLSSVSIADGRVCVNFSPMFLSTNNNI